MIRGEILVVLSLSLLASAAYAIVSLFQAPLKGVTVLRGRPESVVRQPAPGFVFGLAPVALVIHLLHRDGEGVGAIGLSWTTVRVISRAGSRCSRWSARSGSIYYAAVNLGVNRFVVPAPPPHHWWTWLAVVMTAAGAALLEEIVVLAYLITRLLRRLAWSTLAISRHARCCGAPTTCIRGGAGSSATS